MTIPPLNLTLDLDVTASHLFAPTYNDYQQNLYDTITDFREKGWYFDTIADCRGTHTIEGMDGRF